MQVNQRNPVRAETEYPNRLILSQEPLKKPFLLFRWLHVIVCSTMVVFSQNLLIDSLWANLFVILLILSNLWLYSVRQETLERPSFYSAVAIVDIVLITIALVISGQASTDFYMIYFLVIMISALSQELNRIILSTLLVIVLYGTSLLWTTYERSMTDPTVLLRFPFFFIIALFYGTLVQSAKQESYRREQMAQEDVNRIKANFLGEMTHQLLAPLNVVMGNIHLILTGAVGDLTLEQIRMLDQLQLHAEKLLHLTRDLVDLSNIEAKKIALHVRRGSLKPFLKEIETEIVPQLQDKPLRVEFLPDDDLPPLETDWMKLRMVMLHLLANAIQLTPMGQITVLAQKGPGVEEATLIVAETGIRPDQRETPAILERFTQRGASDMQENSGLGVGIAIAKNLVKILGGKIQVKNRTGKGSDFAVTIPLSWGETPKEVVELSYVEPFTRSG